MKEIRFCVLFSCWMVPNLGCYKYLGCCKSPSSMHMRNDVHQLVGATIHMGCPHTHNPPLGYINELLAPCIKWSPFSLDILPNGKFPIVASRKTNLQPSCPLTWLSRHLPLHGSPCSQQSYLHVRYSLTSYNEYPFLLSIIFLLTQQPNGWRYGRAIIPLRTI